MPTRLLKLIFRPIRFGGSRSAPIYYSPSFALSIFVSLVVFHWLTKFPLDNMEALEPLQRGTLLVVIAICVSYVMGIVPSFLVDASEHWGYSGVQCTILSVCLFFILAVWANPNREIALLNVFFQTAGIVSTLALILWPIVKFMGTAPGIEEDEYREWIAFNAANALYRRGEFSYYEAELAAPLSTSGPALEVRLMGLSPKARASIEREMEIERLIQENKRKYGPLMQRRRRWNARQMPAMWETRLEKLGT